MSAKRLFLLITVLLLAGGGVGAYFLLRPTSPPVPAITTDSLDAEVVAVIDKARAGVQAQPRSAAAWGQLGMVLFAQDMYRECDEVLTEAARLDPRDARWPYLRGLALMLTQPEDGIALLRRAAELPPRSPAMRLRLAEECLKLDRIDEAETLLGSLAAVDPDNPRALLGRGQILLRRGQWQEALAPLETAAAHPTAQRSARVALAEASARLGQSAYAADYSRRAAETPADVPWADPLIEEVRTLRTGLQPRIDRALFLSGGGQVDEAVALLEQVLGDHPKSDEANLTLAKVLIRANRHAEAEPALRQAIALKPDLADAHFLLGGIQMLRKDYVAAERSYLRTVVSKANHGRAHYLLGDCRLKRGDRAGAIAAFKDAVRYRPDFALAHLELGALLLEDGQRDAAIAELEHAVQLERGNERARRLLDTARQKRAP
jgi:tetratricopeptide (TPR) repeat protein